MKKAKPGPRRDLAQADKAAIKKQIVDRVARKPEERLNPSKQKRKFASDFGAARRAEGITLTAIQREINLPAGYEHIETVDSDGKTKIVTVAIRPSAKMKAVRRAVFVNRGLLAPYASPTERKKVRRRNNRYASVGTKGTLPTKKTWHRKAAK